MIQKLKDLETSDGVRVIRKKLLNILAKLFCNQIFLYFVMDRQTFIAGQLSYFLFYCIYVFIFAHVVY